MSKLIIIKTFLVLLTSCAYYYSPHKVRIQSELNIELKPNQVDSIFVSGSRSIECENPYFVDKVDSNVVIVAPKDTVFNWKTLMGVSDPINVISICFKKNESKSLAFGMSHLGRGDLSYYLICDKETISEDFTLFEGEVKIYCQEKLE